jgi:hypothetical protein
LLVPARKQLLLGITRNANGRGEGARTFGAGWDPLLAAGTKVEAGG